MNQHLQKILTSIQQDKNLSEEKKNDLIKSLSDANKELEITAFKLDRTEKVKRTTAILLEETIEELEQKRKAVEKQNRELEIESSLERVRTVAMGMRKLEDMLDVCQTISQQLDLLNVKEIRNVQTAIIYESKGTYLNYEYYAKHDKLLTTEVDFKNHPIQQKFASQMLTGAEELFTESIKGEDLPNWYAYQKTTNQFADTYLESATSLTYYWYSLGPVALGMSTYVPLDENEIVLFKRFRNVFELAYRRFIDIEKAIAQAKEAQIQTSLERVRAQAMAMRTPEDLTGICEVLYTELKSLGFAEIRNAMINIHDDENETFVNYDYSDEIGKSINRLVYNIHPVIEKQIKQMRSAGDAFSETYFKGKDLEDWKAFRKEIGEKDDPRIEKAEALYYYFYSIGTGSIGISTFNVVADDKLNVLKRFRNVFNLSYQRYTDIAQAEAQAKEAQIEAALERVRSRSMAMHKSEELADLSLELVKQVQALGVETWFCAFNIYDEDAKGSMEWGSNGQGTFPKYRTPKEGVFLRYYEAGQRGEKLLINEIGESECAAHYEYLCSLPGVGDQLLKMKDAGIPFPASQIDHVAFFKYGYIIFITYEPAPESHDIFNRFAKVFEQTYTRFLDLQKAEAQALRAEQDLIEIKIARKRAEETLTELQSTQKQLIQSEKMASLGELTAGIAHEIQNPLNFVNNFSEVSKELLDEMKEAFEKGDTEEAKEIMNDVIRNLEKINHHGKRADGIVKGMLQHSRSSSNQKEATDINALADEYLRLAYHGLRAKDKSFNATLKTAYDENIGKVSIIPQDMGRVILNLITNAFYVVNEKKNQGIPGYEPTVSVSTKKVNDKIEINVSDNGNGIPQKILDKIFQPFFTTKPTGQGTGLGLSLSYDIVKAHGGELKVETKEGKGSEFNIQLPVD